MARVIPHCDANSFCASVECLYNPAIRSKPVAAAGSVEERHGIILTKNQIAKCYGIQTGEAIWQAKQKYPVWCAFRLFTHCTFTSAQPCERFTRNTPNVWRASCWMNAGWISQASI